MFGFLRLRAPLWYFLALPLAAAAAQRPLTWGDFDSWRGFNTPVLSRDGQWLAYSDMPAKGDGVVVARNCATGRTIRVSVGETPALPFPQPTSASGRASTPQTVSLFFTGDGRFLLSTTFPAAEAMKQARLAGTDGSAATRRGLAIVDLTTGRSEIIPDIKSAQAATAGAWVAYLRDPETPTAKHRPTDTKHGSRLVLRELGTQRERVFEHVTEFTLARDAGTLLFAVNDPNAKRNGVYAFTPGNQRSPVALLRGTGRYQKLIWDHAQSQIAFLSNRTDHGKDAAWQVWHWRRGANAATLAVAATTAGIPAGSAISAHGALGFSRDGQKLYLGTAPIPTASSTPKQDPADTVAADLWSWTDEPIQPRQAVMADTERKRTFSAVFDLAARRYTQIGDAKLREVRFSDDGRRALALDESPYWRERDYDGTYADVYAIDTTTGARRLVVKKLRGQSGDEGLPQIKLSPDGRHAAYFTANHWHVVDLDDGTDRNLTADLPVAFQDELHDQPEPASSCGWGGWLNDNASMLVYDRYDAWLLFTDDRPARNLTGGFGRKNHLLLRMQAIAARDDDDPDRSIDPAQPLYLSGEHELTRASGWFRHAFTATGEPQRLLWGDRQWRYLGRAQQADRLILSTSRFDEFPDYWITDEAFNPPQKVSDGGAQLAPFAWGSTELIPYTSATGVPLQGLLYKPANFDPQKKYPLIVYTYERLSQIVHNFYAPGFGSNINFPFYTSNGYLVYLTDIAYTEGQPGPSALACVNAALDAVIARGFVDENRLGIQGSSWGGYQSAYIITQTDRFRAAVAGSPVGNMTSAYGGIRRFSGLARLFQYEKTQSRIGAPLTEKPELYLANSPVFHVQNVHTPLLIMHNEGDGAVPWEQSIELFLSLRRHGKPVWFFNYEREGHGLIRAANRRDWSLRMWQYFEHYLRDQPAPKWMTDGIPYLDRDAEKLRFNGQRN
ncbi:MAG: S9 family peptidase [Opitutaceae bacterium]|nr:S9 family peptidase [Opitutaceae bacterium]